jgi:hypothetical protein
VLSLEETTNEVIVVRVSFLAADESSAVSTSRSPTGQWSRMMGSPNARDWAFASLGYFREGVDETNGIAPPERGVGQYRVVQLQYSSSIWQS